MCPANTIMSTLLTIADVLGSEKDEGTGTILLQTGDNLGGIVEGPVSEMWGPIGLASRPPKAQPKLASAQTMLVPMGDYDICIAYKDVRGQSIYGELDHGETCLYALGPDSNGGARILLKHDAEEGVSSIATAVSPSIVSQMSTEDGGTFRMALGDAGILSWDSSNGLNFVSGDGKSTISLKDGVLTIGVSQVKFLCGGVQMGSNAGAMSAVANGTTVDSNLATLAGLLASHAVSGNGAPLGLTFTPVPTASQSTFMNP